MKKKFWEYYPLQEEEINTIWTNGIFVFDTNVLFNLYRYSDDTSKEFIDTITTIQEKVWLPFQVGKEFHNKRLEIINNEIKVYENLIKDIKEINDKIVNKNRNPFLSKKLMDFFEKFRDDLMTECSSYIERLESAFRKEDKILERLNLIFNERVGENFTNEELIDILKLGEERYKKVIPPGYRDNSKPSPDKYGDLIIWFQIINKSKKEGKPVVFILDDRKEDWWFIHLGRTMSPRMELLREFREETGQLCCFYQPLQFLEHSRSILGQNINDTTLTEVNELKNDFDSNNGIIELKVKVNNNQSDIVRFVEIIKSIGYQATFKQLEESIFQIITVLPNIPDLERRFNQKYINLLDNYNLVLLDYKKIGDYLESPIL